MTFTFYVIWYSFSVLIGSKRLDDEEAVKKSTLWSLIGILTETGGYLMNTAFNFSKNPKKYFLVSQFMSIISAGLVAYGYFSENLLWARLSNITFGISVSGVFGAMNPYQLLILPRSLLGIPYLVYGIINSAISTVFPLIFRQNDTYERWGYGFSIMGIFLLLSWVINLFFMK
jgi:hypothetical protein